MIEGILARGGLFAQGNFPVAHIGTFAIYIIMACAVIGAIASILDSDSSLGREFMAGLHAIGYIIIPVAGIMAAVPYLSRFVDMAIGPVFLTVGADPAMAATSVIAVDMGGYQLARELALSTEGWIMASITGFMAGATIIFSIPVGLAMLEKSDHKYMALGIMCGILAVPVGVLVSCLVLTIMQVNVRPEITTTGEATHLLALTMAGVARNIGPLIVFCLVLATFLKIFPTLMIRLFLAFGRVLYAAITLILVFSIVEYFTGFFTWAFGGWGFAPIIADEGDKFRALEIAGYIGIMLSGAFPMVYLLQHFLEKPMERLGGRLGMSAAGTTGLLAASANVLAMFRLVKDMPPRDKVLCIAYAVCAAFMFGDHLAFSANFQPTIILPLLLGKFSGGVTGFLIASRLTVPEAELETLA
ncbi:ethanolamine utilization protein EutH [uncultured Amaricoccus sp.]|uniref:ethanolamine utilization protein EutH n=1 Tax=uncultured Amaricoccus sp. TaxID=339341 RepID=UPI0026130E88|nr:ethanolamine utilization protein EutH [uncultured Amaricoccus sp.]